MIVIEKRSEALEDSSVNCQSVPESSNQYNPTRQPKKNLKQSNKQVPNSKEWIYITLKIGNKAIKLPRRSGVVHYCVTGYAAQADNDTDSQAIGKAIFQLSAPVKSNLLLIINGDSVIQIFEALQRVFLPEQNVCEIHYTVSKSTVCLAQEARFDPIYSPGVYASHPNKLDSIFNDKSKLSRRLSKQRKTGIPSTVSRSFSLSRFFRRFSKSRDLLNENSDDMNPDPTEPPTLGRIYLTSSINFDSGSWTSLLEDQPRQSTRLLSTPTQSSSRNLAPKTEKAANAAILRPKSEQVNNE
ncbi:hypothetical protein ACTXT7_000325 [Hymenolepis weldensis]